MYPFGWDLATPTVWWFLVNRNENQKTSGGRLTLHPLTAILVKIEALHQSWPGPHLISWQGTTVAVSQTTIWDPHLMQKYEGQDWCSTSYSHYCLKVFGEFRGNLSKTPKKFLGPLWSLLINSSIGVPPLPYFKFFVTHYEALAVSYFSLQMYRTSMCRMGGNQFPAVPDV